MLIPCRRRRRVSSVTPASSLASMRALVGDANLPGIYWTANGVTQSGGVVSQLDDARGSAGFGASYTASSTAKPGYSAGALNGQPVIVPDGVDDSMVAAGNVLTALKNIGAVTVVSIAATNAAPATNGQILYYSTGSATTITRLNHSRDSVAGKVRAAQRRSDADAINALDAGVSGTSYSVVTSIHDYVNQTLRLYQNGVELTGSPFTTTQGSGSTSNTDSLAANLFSLAASTNFYRGGYAGHFLAYTATPATALQLSRLFAAPYGISF